MLSVTVNGSQFLYLSTHFVMMGLQSIDARRGR